MVTRHRTEFQVDRFQPDHPLWRTYIEHTKRVGMHRWLVDEQQWPITDVYYLGAVSKDAQTPEANQVIGHLALRKQIIKAPPSTWSEEHDHNLVVEGADGKPLTELFVQTFAVENAFRQQGIGTALQEAGLDWARELRCYQVRSWSSLDKPANYQLKIKLGFAIHPAVDVAANDQKISGVFFVKTV